MAERIATSVNGVRIRLTDERWEHILERHDELGERESEILETVSLPDEVQKARAGAMRAVRKRNGLYLVVVYRETSETDGFVITAYLVGTPPNGQKVWSRF